MHWISKLQYFELEFVSDRWLNYSLQALALALALAFAITRVIFIVNNEYMMFWPLMFANPQVGKTKNMRRVFESYLGLDGKHQAMLAT